MASLQTLQQLSPLEALGLLALSFLVLRAGRAALIWGEPWLRPLPPLVEVPLTDAEALDQLPHAQKYSFVRLLCPHVSRFDPLLLEKADQRSVFFWDPATLDYLGECPAMSAEEVQAAVDRARAAQAVWRRSSFSTRRLLMRTMLRYITTHQETCARVAVRESGKTRLCTVLGEIMVTCEKLAWLADEGEQYLRPEPRKSGRMMLMKRVRVEYVPLGVIGAIVPWNYPLHNVFNPLSAALFSGNAIVLKVSEHASWSSQFYKRVVDACLDAVGAPRDLVQIVVGYGATGSALVTSGVDKVIFVGSPQVGAVVARTAAASLTPVVLELGGKDPFVVCDDADVAGIVQTACRGVWQNMGQNCAGPERFFVYEKVYEEFIDRVVRVVKQMRTGAPLSEARIDCGAITMGPKQLLAYQRLVDDAVAKGARLLAGGYIPSKVKVTDENREEVERMRQGSFYPPTVLADVPEVLCLDPLEDDSLTSVGRDHRQGGDLRPDHVHIQGERQQRRGGRAHGQ